MTNKAQKEGNEMNVLQTLMVVEQYENFFNGISEVDFKEISKEEIVEMLNSIKSSIGKKAE